MSIDIPHMIATAAIILGVSWVLHHSLDMQGMSRGRRMLVTFGALFVPILILNAVWPYGSGA